MGMILYVYTNRDRIDCSRNGITNQFDRLCAVNVDGPFEPDENCPGVVLEAGPFDSVRLVPVETKGKHHHMFGGNFAATSDGRFSQAIEGILGHKFYGAVAVHDRIEN